jgi:hypothetical protein
LENMVDQIIYEFFLKLLAFFRNPKEMLFIFMVG